MLCLGIESTAHTFGCGIIDDKGRIYANATDAYKTEKGGIHPSEAKQHHENVKDKIIEEVTTANDQLSSYLGLKTNIVTYPYGAYSDEAIDTLKELGMTALALTDHGAMYG
ncbi:MAG: polysaccharide deacetylase family protein, partial [Nanoarchaeota archaeon]